MSNTGRPIEVVDFEDCTEEASRIGFRCSVAMSSALRAVVDPHVALSSVWALLESSHADPGFAVFRRVARAQDSTDFELPEGWRDSMTRFIARCRSGLGGIADSGTSLGLSVPGKTGPVMMVAQLGWGILRPDRAPGIVLATVDSANFYVEHIAARSIR